MKKNKNRQPKKLSAVFVMLLFLFSQSAFAQPGVCQLACNDTIQVSLGLSCLTEIVADDILEGTMDPDCLGPFEVNLYDQQGILIPTSPFVDDTYQGQFLTVEFVDQSSNNSCEGLVLIEEKLIPLLQCNNLQLDCGTAATPTLPSGAAAPLSLDAVNGCNTLSIPVSLSGTLSDVNISFEVEHNDISELSASLTSPAGVLIDLFTQPACNNNDLALWFDQEASATYLDLENTCGAGTTPAISGNFQAEGDLSTVYGENVSNADMFTFTLCNTNLANTAMATNINLVINTNGLNIPFPVPASALISQTVSQQASNTYTVEDFDNCTTATLSYTEQTVVQDCANPISEILYRTWTVEDAYGNARSCVDTIAFNRLAAGAITFPDDFNGTAQAALLCEDLEKDPGNSVIPNVGWNALPNGHPAPEDEYYPAPNDNVVKWQGTGVPVAMGCESISYSYSDLRVEVCTQGASSACFKILRTWNIYESCSGQNYIHQQTIKVDDTTGPQLSGLADVTVSTPSESCMVDWYAPIPVLSDNCNPTSNLSYTVHSSAGTVAYVAGLDRFHITGLPLGTHTITYTASDCCGNSSITTINLSVEDQVPPTANCVSYLISNLTIDGTVRIQPHSFDDLSNDNCGPLYYKVIRMNDLLGTTDGSNSNQSSTTCDSENGDDNDARFGNQIYFDDYVAFCCEDRTVSNHMVVLRTFDVDPGDGPVNPNRMRPGGDLHGHFNDCMSEVDIEDKLAPVITCPDHITLECTQDFTDLSLTGMATAFDNCELDTLYFNDVSNLDPCGVGTVARIWTAVDHSGRSVSCNQIITMQDNTPAQVTFPPINVLVECGEEFDFGITGFPQTSDNCRLLGISNLDEFHYFADSCLRKIIRTWNVMDLCSDSMWSQIQVIKIEDTTPPEITGVPSDITVDCDNIPSAAQPAIIDACDPTLDISFVESVSPGACPQESVITRTWTASDNCSNSNVVTQVITVIDTVAPIFIGVPGAISLACDQAVPTDAPSATDNCDPLVDIVYSENTIPGICANTFILERIWTASDDCGNSSIATQQVSFTDSSDPIFTFVPADTLLQCDEAVPNADPIATDNCDNIPVITLSEEILDGACPGNQTIIRTWTATDNCGNTSTSSQTLTIVDTTPPALSGFPMDTLVSCDAALPVGEPTVTDNCDATPDLVFAENIIPGACEDNFSISRSWTFTDDCGNDSSYVQIITVVDTTAPVFTNVPTDMTLECDGMPTDITPVATDNCDAMVEVVLMQSDAPGCIGNATITRTWRATDNCGNTAEVVQQITFMDSTPPMLSGVPADATVECDAVPLAATVTAMDACDPMVIVDFNELRTDGVCTDSYTLTRTWSAADDCGNVRDSVQVLTVVDTTIPVFDNDPQDVTLACTDPTDPSAGGLLSPPTASDNCDLMVEITFADQTSPGGCTNESGITRTWTATDNCGNSATRVQVITILDEEVPVLSGVPADITVLCDAIPMAPTNITAMDNCDMMVVPVLEESTGMVICTDSYTLIRRWIATDDCGNVAVDTQLIMVIDTIAPILTGIPGDSTVQCNEVPAPPMINAVINASDNCDNEVMITFSQDTTDVICTDEYTLVRKWTAVDNCGNTTVDSQLLMLIDTVAPSLLNIPANLTVECDRLQDTTNVLLVSATDNCDTNVRVTYTENEDGTCPNTYIIIRRWTATDNCGNVNTKQQLINVIDTVPPALTCPEDITITLRPNDNPNIFVHKCDTLLDLIPTATDNCADVTTIINDSPFAPDSIGAATGRYPIGVHVVNFTAIDRCGNSSTCSTTVTVIDNTKPTFTCSDFEINLDPVTMDVSLTTDQFLSFYADCSFDTAFFIFPVQTDILTLDCSYKDEAFNVGITVVDTSGNESSCILPALTLANPEVCPVPPAFSYVVGNINHEDGDPLEDMMVYLEGGMTMETPTYSTGRYAFNDLPTNRNYSIKPFHDENYRKGVSTLDMVLISRHLIGLQALDSPYKLIAADVNNSKSVSTLDLIEIQKLILYMQDEFPNNTSWRFVDANYEFTNPANPFSSSFPEVCHINGLAYGQSDIDFVGVKIGDVNGSAMSGLVSAGSDREDPGVLEFTTADQSLSPGQEVQIDFRAKDFKEIYGFQFTLDFDPAHLIFKEAEAGALPAPKLGEHFLREGFLLCNWYDRAAQDFEPETVLFSLKFIATATTQLSEVLEMNSARTIAEAYAHNLEVKKPFMSFREVIREEIVPELFELFPNRPNPFKDETIIAFQLPKASKTILTISDVSGKVLKREKRSYEAGYHEVAIQASELADANGILYYQLITSEGSATRKMVMVKR